MSLRRWFILGCVLTPWMGVVALAHARDGETRRYAYNGRDVGWESRAWTARAYLHPSVRGDQDTPRPLVVFLHGVNPQRTRHLWMGGGESPDLRDVVSKMIERKTIAPVVVAVPSATVSCTLPTAMWTGFDLDRFLERTIRATRDALLLDMSRVILVGHSGGGCNETGGLLTGLRSAVQVRAVLSIDTCMYETTARSFARAPREADVVFTWQPRWKREIDAFRDEFYAESARRGAFGLRVIERYDLPGRTAHTEIVELSLKKWLPVWVGRGR